MDLGVQSARTEIQTATALGTSQLISVTKKTTGSKHYHSVQM